MIKSLAKYRDLGIDAFLLTIGAFGIWEPRPKEFALRVKHEL